MSRFPLETAAGGARGHAWRLSALMLAAALALAPAGCKKKVVDDKGEDKVSPAKRQLEGVSAGEKSWTRRVLSFPILRQPPVYGWPILSWDFCP